MTQEFTQALKDIIDLEQLWHEGNEESTEADLIRERSDKYWHKLADKEKRFIGEFCERLKEFK